MRAAGDEGTTALSSSDPRLQRYVDRIWSPAGPGSPVSVTLGAPPGDHVVAEQYAVVPHRGRTRMLVPLATRAATVASLRCYNATRAPASRVLRAALWAGYAAGVSERLFSCRLTVGVDRRVPPVRWHEHLLVSHLALELGLPRVHAFTAVRRINPNAKPTLQMFDDAGRAVGYAKLGSTPATRQMVATEARAMADLHGALAGIVVPALLAEGSWQDVAYAVSSPLPADVRRWRGGPDATAPAIKAVARSSQLSRRPLPGSSYASRLRRRLRGSDGHSDHQVTAAADDLVNTDVAAVLEQWLGRLEQDSTPVEFGRMHGDWTPDNIGRSREGVAVWDWEHSSDDVPLGFDLLHWHFHTRLAAAGLPAAVSAVDQAASRLRLLGVDPGSHRLVASLYLLDVFARRLGLARGGGGWSQIWYPGLLDIARYRDRH